MNDPGRAQMGKIKKLNCLEKREILNRSAVSIGMLIALGKLYEDEGLLHDAVDFYERANAVEPLQGMLAKVKEEGDVFLFTRISKILGRQISKAEWQEIAHAAEKLGKYHFAKTAYSQIETIENGKK